MNDNEAAVLPGMARRHDNWDEVSAISSIGRRSMAPIPNYRLLRAATCIDATAAARLLLVHLIGYLGPDDDGRPASRFVVFPGNTHLSDELRCSVRSIQRQADELEELGMLRRCYNGVNRRTGFDLTPFAMRHGAVVAEICEIHTKRRIAAEANQLELGLASDRIERPFGATCMSSGGDTDVTLNRTEGSPVCSRTKLVSVLDTIDPRIIADVPHGAFEGFDRTEEVMAAAAAHATTRFTRGGRTPSLAWSAAVSGLGMRAAVGLYAVASADPRRRASVERYFSWLLRMATDGKGSDAVVQASARASANPRRAVETGTPMVGCTTIGDAVSAILGRNEGAVPAPAAEDRCARVETVEAVRNGGTQSEIRNARPTEIDLWEPMGPPRQATNVAGRIVPDRACEVQDALRSVVEPRLFAAWLGKASFEVREDLLVVSVPGAFAAGWVEDNMSRQIGRVIGEIAPGLTLKVERMLVGAAG